MKYIYKIYTTQIPGIKDIVKAQDEWLNHLTTKVSEEEGNQIAKVVPACIYVDALRVKLIESCSIDVGDIYE